MVTISARVRIPDDLTGLLQGEWEQIIERAGRGDRPALCHGQNTADRSRGGAGHGAQHDHPQTAADLRTSAAHGSKAADDKRVTDTRYCDGTKAPGRSDPVGEFPHVVLRKQEHFIKFF